MSLLLLALALQRTTCECGAWIEPKDGVLDVGHGETKIASAAVYRGKTELLGKAVDLTKPNTLTCLCERKVEVPVLYAMPAGTFKCGACGGGWRVDGKNLTAVKADGATVVAFPLKDGVAEVKGAKWLQKLPEVIDVMAFEETDCVCGGGAVRFHEGAPKNPGGPPPKKKPKAGKQLGEFTCGCGGKVAINEGIAVLSFGGKEIVTVEVGGGNAPFLGTSVSLEFGSGVKCACGRETTIPPLLKP